MFVEWEERHKGERIDLDTFIGAMKFNNDGLIPAIAQQHDTGEVLMMAWMNEASLRESLQTGQVCYWSRSRQTFWRKGETSGNRQSLVSLLADCDGDTLLLKVNQLGPACHTGRRHCFYFELTESGAQVTADKPKS